MTEFAVGVQTFFKTLTWIMVPFSLFIFITFLSNISVYYYYRSQLLKLESYNITKLVDEYFKKK